MYCLKHLFMFPARYAPVTAGRALRLQRTLGTGAALVAAKHHFSFFCGHQKDRPLSGWAFVFVIRLDVGEVRFIELPFSLGIRCLWLGRHNVDASRRHGLCRNRPRSSRVHNRHTTPGQSRGQRCRIPDICERLGGHKALGCGGRPGRPTGRYWPAAPRFFSGAIQLDQLIQISSVFGKVQDSRSWFVDSYSSLAAWRDATDRLTSFEDHIRAMAQQQRAQDATYVIANSGVEGRPGQLLVSGLSVSLPAGLMAREALLQNLSLQAGPGDTVLFKGPSGRGKSMLFRILAGIWPFFKRTKPSAGQRHVYSAAALLSRWHAARCSGVSATCSTVQRRRAVGAVGGGMVSIAHRPSVAAFHSKQWVLEKLPEGAAARYELKESALPPSGTA